MSFILLEYERDEYQKYLKDNTKEATYQDFENEIYKMNELRKSLKEKGYEVAALIDQVDNVYYGDILFKVPKGLSETELHKESERIVKELVSTGVIDSNCGDICMYFNKVLWGFLYTAVIVKDPNGPNLYAGGSRSFVIR